jgi:hypothetical protein
MLCSSGKSQEKWIMKKPLPFIEKERQRLERAASIKLTATFTFLFT